MRLTCGHSSLLPFPLGGWAQSTPCELCPSWQLCGPTSSQPLWAPPLLLKDPSPTSQGEAILGPACGAPRAPATRTPNSLHQGEHTDWGASAQESIRTSIDCYSDVVGGLGTLCQLPRPLRALAQEG